MARVPNVDCTSQRTQSTPHSFYSYFVRFWNDKHVLMVLRFNLYVMYFITVNKYVLRFWQVSIMDNCLLK